MKKIAINPSIAVGMVFCISFTQAMAQSRPALINPGTELAPVTNMPKTGIAHTPLRNNDKQQLTQQAVAQASVSGLSYVLRCPAADPNNPDCNDIQQWKLLESSTAYYRDPIIAALTPIINATDGETWSVNFIKPDGGQINIGPVSFSSNGNCFNLTNYTVCGSNDINIYWYFDNRSQCTETGDWRVEAKHNGNLLGTLDFYVRPQLGTPAEVAATLPSYAQTNTAYSQQPYANTCHDFGKSNFYSCSLNKPEQIPWTIGQQGCTLTSLASILSYFGTPVDPPTLNQWLIKNNFYEADVGEIDQHAITAFANERNVDVTWLGEGSDDSASLNRNICTYGPVPIRVDSNTHTVTAIGQNDDLTTVSILDADDGVKKELTDPRYYNYFSSQYLYSGPEHRFSDKSGLTFLFHSPVEAFVVDPNNRRQGIDPRNGVHFNEIPRASYGIYSTIGPMVPSDYTPPQMLDIVQPIEGIYTLTVIGTDTGTYDTDFSAYDINSHRSRISIKDMPTAPNIINIYQINFTKAAGSKIQLGGGFDGGGQRPKDVNRFLSYANPGANRTTLPTTAADYSLLLFYGASIIPASFNAQLNDADITALFHPAQGTGDKVLLNLQPGRNVLVLSVDGDVGGRVATDTDRLVFDLQ